MYDSYVSMATTPKLKQIVDDQTKLTESDVSDEEAEMALILDDIAYDYEFLNSKTMKFLAMNGRQIKLFTLVCCQYIMQLSTALRGNIDVVALTKEPSPSNQKKAYDAFGGACQDNHHLFKALFQACIKNRGVLVIDNTVTSTAIEDCFFWYRAEWPPPVWKLGTDPEYINYHIERVQAAMLNPAWAVRFPTTNQTTIKRRSVAAPQEKTSVLPPKKSKETKRASSKQSSHPPVCATNSSPHPPPPIATK